MVDTVTTNILVNGARIAISFTNESDGTGETNVVKVNSGVIGGGDNLKIVGVTFSTQGMAVKILWEGQSANTLVCNLPVDHAGNIDFRGFGGLLNNAVNPTGNILFSTIGASSGDSYAVVLELAKN